MKRSGMPPRKQRLKTDPEKVRQWERASRKPIAPKSKKRAGEDRARTKLKRTLILAAGLPADGSGPVERGCAGHVLAPEVVCASPWGSRPRFEMHEVVKRSRWRKGLTVRSNVVLLCQAHHDWTESEVAAATEVGLLARAPNVHPFDKFDAYHPEEGDGDADSGEDLPR